MKFNIIQTISNLSAAYELRENDNTIGRASIANNFTCGGSIECTFFTVRFTLSYAPHQQAESWSKPRQEKTDIPYQLFRNGELCGQIFLRTSTGGLLSRFTYFGMQLDECQYAMYPVGLGKEGIKYPIYTGEKQIALIEKAAVVHDNLDCYQVTALGEKEGSVAALFGLYLDARSFANRGEIVKSSIEKTYYLTTNKRLKAMYDPAFKLRADV